MDIGDSGQIEVPFYLSTSNVFVSVLLVQEKVRRAAEKVRTRKPSFKIGYCNLSVDRQKRAVHRHHKIKRYMSQRKM